MIVLERNPLKIINSFLRPFKKTLLYGNSKTFIEEIVIIVARWFYDRKQTF
jgi:hypothetical protein